VRIVVDTNVLVSGAFFSGPPSWILDACFTGQHEMVVSPKILEEYLRVASQFSKQRPNKDFGRFLALMLFIFAVVVFLARSSIFELRAKAEERFIEKRVSELRNVGIGSVVAMVDEDADTVRITRVDHEPEDVARIEAIIQKPFIGTVFRVDDSATFRPMVRERRTIYTEDMRGVLLEMAPDAPREEIFARAQQALGVPRGIHAPLVADDRVIGVLGVVSGNLEESDVPAITAFAHQLLGPRP